MAKKLKAALVGCGRIGAEFDNDPKRKYISTHAGAYASVKGVDLVAVCDTDLQKAARCADRWGVRSVYTDLGRMLKEKEIDILSICTPPGSHYAVLKEVSAYPVKAVFCEKPLAGNMEEALAMVDICSKKGIILQVDHQRRFDRLHQELSALISAGKLGEVLAANFYYTAGIKNTGSHMFDLMRFFFGDADWVEAFPSKNVSANANDPNLDGILRFKSGLFATFQACDVSKYLIFEMNILFEKGRIILKNSGFDIECHAVKPSVFFSGYKELSKSGKLLDTDYRKDFMVNAVKHLSACVRRKSEPVSSGSDGLKAMELIEKSLLSAENSGKRMSLI